MLRACYSFLLRLHPAFFRREYQKEMLAIFDEVAASESVTRLFTDVTVSLFRQWILRPEFRRIPDNEAVPAASANAPVLMSLDSYTPRVDAVLVGCLLTLASFSAVITVSIRPGKPIPWLIGIHKAVDRIFSVSRSSLTGSSPDTLVRVGEDPVDSSQAATSAYFKSIPVLGVLDANGDFVISRAEIAAAPSALGRLDLNHDGKLSTEECGLLPGRPPLARKGFMLAHPVLRVLDADHDGEISADEIRNSSGRLLILDRNRDGSLTPDEVMPDKQR